MFDPVWGITYSPVSVTRLQELVVRFLQSGPILSAFLQVSPVFKTVHSFLSDTHSPSVVQFSLPVSYVIHRRNIGRPYQADKSWENICTFHTQLQKIEWSPFISKNDYNSSPRWVTPINIKIPSRSCRTKPQTLLTPARNPFHTDCLKRSINRT